MNIEKAEKTIRMIVKEYGAADITSNDTHIIIDGEPYALHLVKLRKKPTTEDKTNIKKETSNKREYDMLLSVKDNPIKPSKEFARHGHDAKGASGVLIGLRKRGLVEKVGQVWTLTKDGEYVLQHKKVDNE